MRTRRIRTCQTTNSSNQTHQITNSSNERTRQIRNSSSPNLTYLTLGYWFWENHIWKIFVHKNSNHQQAGSSNNTDDNFGIIYLSQKTKELNHLPSCLNKRVPIPSISSWERSSQGYFNSTRHHLSSGLRQLTGNYDLRLHFKSPAVPAIFQHFISKKSTPHSSNRVKVICPVTYKDENNE